MLEGDIVTSHIALNLSEDTEVTCEASIEAVGTSRAVTVNIKLESEGNLINESKTFNDQEQVFDHDDIELNWSEAKYPEYKIYKVTDAELVIPEFEDERQVPVSGNIVSQFKSGSNENKKRQHFSYEDLPLNINENQLNKASSMP